MPAPYDGLDCKAIHRSQLPHPCQPQPQYQQVLKWQWHTIVQSEGLSPSSLCLCVFVVLLFAFWPYRLRPTEPHPGYIIDQWGLPTDFTQPSIYLSSMIQAVQSYLQRSLANGRSL